MTKGDNPTNVPRNIKVKPSDSTQLKVQWDNLDRNKWFDEIIAYYVGFKKQRSVYV